MPHQTPHIARQCWLSAINGIYNVPAKSGVSRYYLIEFYLMRAYEV